ncbi:MAG: hypothetical protein ACOY0T_37520 [Myxococcota bacterium]
MFVAPRDLENRIGKDRYRQLLDHDLDGRADDSIVAEVCTDANREIESLLLGKGFSHDQLVRLSQDETLRRQGAWIAAEYAALTKPALVAPDGTTMYTAQAKAARDVIKTIASAERRLSSEQSAGQPKGLLGYVSEPNPDFYVAPSVRNPKGPGGF